MELDEAIKNRRSIRRYKDQPVSVDLVREVLEAGTWVPSAKNGQRWRFTVLTGEVKRALTDLFRMKLEVLSGKIMRRNMGSSFSSCSIMEEAPVLIVVWNAGEMGWETEVHSVAAAVQNMLLKAHALGLGACWIGDRRHFVYPLIEESEALSVKDAESAFRSLKEEVYPDLRLALVHSRVPDDEMLRATADFAAGKIDILVATSVVEVGVDVANATCMVVEHAERFGLSTLHQLRGRVGRGPWQSYAFLIYGRDLTPDGVE